MYCKIITCPCYDDLIMEIENQIIKRIYHFHCKCNVPHELKVWVSQAHPFFPSMSGANPMQCFCKTSAHYEICSCCIEKRYLVNFKAAKICLRHIPDYMKK